MPSLIYGKLRLPFFLLFTASFLFVSGSVLFHAFGYRFSFERGIFIYTGSITIKSNPENIQVTLDRELLNPERIGIINNTLHIGGIPPGEHTLRISAPGYRSWEKRVAVHSGVSTEFWNVLLPREDYARVEYADSAGTLRIFPSPKANLFALLRASEERQSIALLDTDTGTVSDIFSSPDLQFPEAATDNMEWSPNADRLIVPMITTGQDRHILLFDIPSGENIDITPYFGEKEAVGVRWNPAVDNSLLALAEGALLRLDLPEEMASGADIQAPLTLSLDVSRYDISQEDIFVLGTDHHLVRFDAAVVEPQKESVAPLDTIGDETARTLVVYDEDRAAIITQNSNLFLYDRQDPRSATGRYLGSQVSRAQFSDDGKKLLFSGEHEVAVCYLRAWDVQPAREAGTLQQLLRYADPISLVQWTKDYEHVLFEQKGILRVAELDHRDQRNVAVVMTLGSTPGDMVSRLGEDRVFVATPYGDSQGIGLFSFPFPDSSALFGTFR